MDDIVILFLIGSAVIVLACFTILAYVFYRWRKDDVISIDNFDDAGDYQVLKDLAEDLPALRQVGREHAAGVYRNLD